LFVRDSTLMAQPVDARSLEPRGEPFPVVEQVNSGSQIGYGQFSTSPNGTLVYQAGQGINGRQLAWFDRGGRPLGIVGEAGRIWDFSISPDDKRLAIARTDVQLRTSDLWIHDLQRGPEPRFTSHPSLNQRPVWSFDGARIMFSSSRAGRTDLYRKISSGTAPEETVLTTDYPKYAMDSSRDGKVLIYHNTRDIYAVSLTESHQSIPLIHSDSVETQPQLSPDNRWLAYVSDESGRNEIYVQPFSLDAKPPANRWMVSSSGGTDPRWRRDGKELF